MSLVDIKALQLLSKEIQRLEALPDPPRSYDKIGEYETAVNKVINASLDTVQDVAKYAQTISETLEKFRLTLAKSTDKVKQLLKKELSLLKVGTDNYHPPKPLIDFAQRLQQLEVKKQRLEESILQTGIILNKIERGIACTVDDINTLKGCINSWVEEKHESYEDEKRRREEEERRRKEEAERRKREEEERKRREEEERKRREEEERRRREEEERRRKEEEERMKEEEERRRREEEERKKREEEERIRLEEEDRKKREAEERKKREDEERRRKEEEENRKRRAAEEKRRREEEERRKREEMERRRNPQNWPSFTYKRSDGDIDGGFHKGLCCSVSAMDDCLTEDALECMASDEDRDVLPCVDVGEKLAGSLVTVKSTTGEKSLEVPMRVFVPHCNVSDTSEELILKTSVDGSDWQEWKPIAGSSSRECKVSGVEVNNFNTVRVIAVAKTKCQELMVDKLGIHQPTTADKNIKLFMPRDTFEKPTQVKIQVRSVKDESLLLAAKHHKNCDNVLSTSSIVSVTCQNTTNKDIEIDIARPTSSNDMRSGKGRYHHLFKGKGESWKFADSELKGRNMDVSITLPAGYNRYSVIEIEARQSTGREEVLKAAEEIYSHAHESVVRVLVKQKRDNPSVAVIHCVPRDAVETRLGELEKLKYTSGPDTSREFCILDGQYLEFDCRGNIKMSAGNISKVKLPFHAYMDSCKQEVTLEVVDPYKQKDMETYIGHIHFELLRDNRDGAFAKTISGELPVTLPKLPMTRQRASHAPLQLSHNLLALSKFVAWRLTKNETGLWESFVQYLVPSQSEVNRLRRQATTKCDEDTEEWRICEVIMKDWMKSKPFYDDKVEPILQALHMCGRQDILDECLRFEKIHNDVFGSKRVSEMASLVGSNWEELADNLGVSNKTVEEIKRQKHTREEQAYMMFCKWRISDDAIQRGDNVLTFLLDTAKTHSDQGGLFRYIEQYINVPEK